MDESQGELRRRKPKTSLLHRAFWESWPKVAEAAAEGGGLPKRVKEEVRRYLRCGDVRWGFTQTRCEECRESALIAFSCKTRGWCPSCAARRGHQTAEHLLAVLPAVAYRQWTLSLPRALCFELAKDASWLRKVERELVRAIFRWQRRRAKELGATERLKGGAVSFVQTFNSQLQL